MLEVDLILLKLELQLPHFIFPVYQLEIYCKS